MNTFSHCRADMEAGTAWKHSSAAAMPKVYIITTCVCACAPELQCVGERVQLGVKRCRPTTTREQLHNYVFLGET